jgi:hypothetical protein
MWWIGRHLVLSDGFRGGGGGRVSGRCTGVTTAGWIGGTGGILWEPNIVSRDET